MLLMFGLKGACARPQGLIPAGPVPALLLLRPAVLLSIPGRTWPELLVLMLVVLLMLREPITQRLPPKCRRRLLERSLLLVLLQRTMLALWLG